MYSKINKIILCSSLLLLLAATSMAQQPLVSAAKKAELDQLSADLRTTLNASQQQAFDLAPRFNWNVRKKLKDGSVIALQRLTPLGFPVYYRTYNNTIAAATTRTNTLQPGGTSGLNLSGSSAVLANKLGMWDGGAVLSTHQEFAGKTVTLRNPGITVDLHSTHVAGTMIAKGVYAPAKGMSFNASTLQVYDFDSDLAEMSSAASGLLLSNHSYGTVAGWNYDQDELRWEWYGIPGDTEDYKFGYYDSDARDADRITFNAPYYLPVKSAGNNRTSVGPAVGGTYFGYTSRTDRTLISKTRDASISSNNGFDVISTFGNAKNILTVGAISQLPYGPSSRSDVTISPFSSQGPTDDGRIKPDICADGDQVLSTSSSSPTAYTTLSGTSMSAPNVTGSLYLLQEYYAQKNGNAFMRSATLKALVCHTAFDAGNVGPDYTFGWGVLDAGRAAQVITDKGGKSLMNESTLAQGQTNTTTVVASGNGTLIATIAWTDPQGTVSPDGTLNDRTPKLVNDLDIRISDGTTTYQPWVLSFQSPAAAATRGDNVRDNIEQVYIDNAIPGRTYTITVKHKGTLTSGPQAYSMIVTGVGGAAYCASVPTSSADSRINNVTISNLNNTPPAGCTTYTDLTNLTPVQLEQGRTYPLSLTLGTCGANFNKRAKVFIDWNNDGTFDPVTELAATSGVINATGTFTADVAVPGTVTPGNYSLMRIVLVETSDAAAIQPCGTYNKGETQDYRVQFTQSSRDVGAISVTNSSATGGCAGPTRVSVRLKNFGGTAITNIPVTVTITPVGGGATITLNQTYTGTLNANAEDDLILNGTFNATAGSSYLLTAVTSLANDPVSSNNQVSSTISIAANPAPTDLTASYCNDTRQYLLTANADGQVLWYTTPTGGDPVTTGATALTRATPINNIFYAGVNDLNTSVGPATKSGFTGAYGQYGQSVYLTTKLPVILQSARLYVGNTGRINVIATNAAGEEVGRTAIDVTQSRSTPGTTDDANDQGRVYDLNLLLPQAGSYRLNVTYANGATLYRSNNGNTRYPYGTDVFNIRGNNATSSTNPADTSYYRNFYYFFYDMKVIGGGCSSTARVPVTVSTISITQNGATLVSNFANNNQWYLNGVAISGATAQTYTPAQSGNYQLRNVLTTGCTAISPVYTYIKPGSAENVASDIKLSAFPVPASTQLNLSLVAPQAGDLTVSLVNLMGQTVYSNRSSIQAGNYVTNLSVASLPPGTYVLRVILGSKAYTAKIIVAK
ncbi:S8 family serine peptidase [Mucilaginibacter daejeonensis]|uniref:S8 family serine peptidase n=1 Tax=Mucilaginibacter daejeonensis TaxID=398049 RepID=UPI001D1775C0|nr:S8 family serine peptidase [Mucilaginibacter daejeonensis]UEG54333.1 S8 family serine peptidase [Mucilaginibacter daejeonensis]